MNPHFFVPVFVLKTIFIRAIVRFLLAHYLSVWFVIPYTFHVFMFIFSVFRQFFHVQFDMFGCSFSCLCGAYLQLFLHSYTLYFISSQLRTSFTYFSSAMVYMLYLKSFVAHVRELAGMKGATKGGVKHADKKQMFGPWAGRDVKDGRVLRLLNIFWKKGTTCQVFYPLRDKIACTTYLEIVFFCISVWSTLIASNKICCIQPFGTVSFRAW